MPLPHDREKPGQEKPKQPVPSPSEPDGDLPRRSGRVHITARQRGTDATDRKSVV